MAGNFLAGDFLAHAVTFGDFMVGNFLAGDFLTRIPIFVQSLKLSILRIECKQPKDPFIYLVLSFEHNTESP